MATATAEKTDTIESRLIAAITAPRNSEITEARNYENHYRNYAERYRRDVERYTRDAEQNEKLAQEHKEKADKMEAEYNASDAGKLATEKTATLLKRLQKHALFDSIEVSGTTVKITTRLLFTEIRKEDGSEDTNRACIGAYRIEFNTTQSYNFRVYNLLYRGHWSVSGAYPCLGEWEKGFYKLMETQDIYGVFDMFTHYLRSTFDHGAYMSAQSWRASYRRVKRPIEATDSPPMESGGYVVFIGEEHDGESLEGCVARVDEVFRHEDEWMASCYFREYENQDGDYYDDFHWNVPCDLVQTITEAEYKEKPHYSVIRRAQRVNIKIDALQEGATLADAHEIIKESAERGVRIE